jgi:hypothetical protein
MLWVVLLVACGGEDDSDTSSEAPSADFQLVEEPGCETYTDEGGTEYPVPGATGYYIGELEFSGEDVTGYEARVLFANDAWVENEPEAGDCRVTWRLSGVKQDPLCASCDYSVALHATLDRTESDCLEAFTNAEPQEWDEIYDVALTEDGAATLYFDSGTTLAPHGGGTESGLWYQSDSQCLWF